MTVNQALRESPGDPAYQMASAFLQHLHDTIDTVRFRRAQAGSVLPAVPIIPDHLITLGDAPHADWGDMGLEAKRAFLVVNQSLLSVANLVGSGLTVGAQRMDEARETADQEPINYGLMEKIIDSREADDIFTRGNTEVSDTYGGQASIQVGPLYHNLALISPELRNPRIAAATPDLVRSGVKSSRNVNAALKQQAFNAMEQAQWSEELRALAFAVCMQASARKAIRTIIRPLIDRDIPKAVAGQEDHFWASKILGAEPQGRQIPGTQYYLGYLAKSQPLVRQHENRLWDEEAQRNAQVFRTALFIRNTYQGMPYSERQRREHMRRTVFGSIGEGDFAGAESEMRSAAGQDQSIFNLPGLRFLLSAKEFSLLMRRRQLMSNNESSPPKSPKKL